MRAVLRNWLGIPVSARNVVQQVATATIALQIAEYIAPSREVEAGGAPWCVRTLGYLPKCECGIVCVRTNHTKPLKSPRSIAQGVP